jgi:hypothetical protein
VNHAEVLAAARAAAQACQTYAAAKRARMDYAFRALAPDTPYHAHSLPIQPATVAEQIAAEPVATGTIDAVAAEWRRLPKRPEWSPPQARRDPAHIARLYRDFRDMWPAGFTVTDLRNALSIDSHIAHALLDADVAAGILMPQPCTSCHGGHQVLYVKTPTPLGEA